MRGAHQHASHRCALHAPRGRLCKRVRCLSRANRTRPPIPRAPVCVQRLARQCDRHPCRICSAQGNASAAPRVKERDQSLPPQQDARALQARGEAQCRASRHTPAPKRGDGETQIFLRDNLSGQAAVSLMQFHTCAPHDKTARRGVRQEKSARGRGQRARQFEFAPPPQPVRKAAPSTHRAQVCDRQLRLRAIMFGACKECTPQSKEAGAKVEGETRTRNVWRRGNHMATEEGVSKTAAVTAAK